MTKQEAADMIRNDMKLHHDYLSGQYRKALNIAIKALEECNLEEWCLDCKEYDHEHHCCPRYNRVIRESIKVKSGKWIKIPGSHWDSYVCDQCGRNNGITKTKYCSRCGARMEGESDGK